MQDLTLYDARKLSDRFGRKGHIPMFPKTSSRWLLLGPLLLVVSLVLVSCGGSETATTTTERQVIVSPGAGKNIPADVEHATLTISGGAFQEDDLRLLKGQPTMLSIVNRDDKAYQFKIEGFLLPQKIPASTTKDVSFTTPSIEDYTGQLLEADGKTVLADVHVVIQAVTGANP